MKHKFKEGDIVMLTGEEKLRYDPKEYMTEDKINSKQIHIVEFSIGYDRQEALLLEGRYSHCYAAKNFTLIGQL